MATALKNLSEIKGVVPSGKGKSFGIVVSEWNDEITNPLLEGAYDTLIKHGVSAESILVKTVPGSFELVLGAQLMLENTEVDAVICLGCVVQGETPHFDYICQGVTKGITDLNMSYNTPVVFGLLTTNNIQQARDRSGGRYGNKGIEAAVTALKMATLQADLESLSE
jgi:6,7-dimethyl-8-ribityllumazine synthase